MCSLKVKADELTLIDDDSLHSLFELVGGAETLDGSAQHPLLLGQPALQSGYLISQQLILIWRIAGKKGFGLQMFNWTAPIHNVCCACVYLLVVAAVSCYVPNWQRYSPHQFEQSASLLQHLVHGVNAAG